MQYLKLPIVRHIVAAAVIIGIMYAFGIAPLERRCNEQDKLIKDLALKSTYKIENRVENPKIKKGGEIILIPENQIIKQEATVKQDSVKAKKRTWAGRQLQKIANLFKKD